MNTNQIFRRIGLSVSLFSAILLVDTSCSRSKEIPEPQAVGTLLVYTKLIGPKADRIDVIVDDKLVGPLTRNYIDLDGNGPGCSTQTSGSVVSIKLSAGKHTLAAKQYLGGKEVDEWEPRTKTIYADKCLSTNLTE
ncbi:hypothetical protein [Spirosoma sp.]|uniref:hypothetical protein n=1 Tax=Spirosoma sp. TaxID=1899569 RepID=UPI003B3A58DC